jgi:hypothetical protein
MSKLRREISVLEGQVVCLEEKNAALRATLRAALSGDRHNGRHDDEGHARKRVEDALQDSSLVSAAITVIGQALKSPDKPPIGWSVILVPDADTLQRCLTILEAVSHNHCTVGEALESFSRLAEQQPKLWSQIDAIFAGPVLFSGATKGKGHAAF